MSKIGPRVWPLPWEHDLKMHVQTFFSDKSCYKSQYATSSANFFWSPYGCGLCPDSTIRFFGEKCLKNVLYKSFCQTKVTNQNLQLLCYVTFFDILHHFGVIAASQICSVSRKYCAILRNRFFCISLSQVGLSNYLFIYLSIYLCFLFSILYLCLYIRPSLFSCLSIPLFNPVCMQ